jgi:non-homologous end joining protein Ku
LYPAVAANERISFRQVNKQTGNRLRQQLVDTVTGEPVRSDQKARGYEVGKNQFLLVRNDELAAAEQEARRRPYSAAPAKPTAQEDEQSESRDLLAAVRPYIAARLTSTPERKETSPGEAPSDKGPDRSNAVPTPIENNRTIEIDRFIPRAQVDPRYLDTPYYAVPRGEIGEEAFAVIRDAMRRKGVVGMGRIVLARRERPIILEPMADGIRGITLRYSHEIREEAGYFAPRLRLPDEMVRVAEHIVETKTTDFDPAFLEDRYRTVLISKLKEKHSELPKKAVATKPSAENVISLMDVLKRSLAAERPTARSVRANTPAGRMPAPSKNSSSRRSKCLIPDIALGSKHARYYFLVPP